MKTEVSLESKDGVYTLKLIPPDGRRPPTLDFGVLDSIETSLGAARDSGGCSALVLRSESKKFFCGGGNLDALGRIDEYSMGSWIARGHQVFDAIESFPAPVIAVVNGYALGGGLEIALACDFIYAYDSASVGQTETRVGFVSGWGGSFRLARRIGVPRAKELFYTARILTAEEGYALGVVDFAGTPEAVEQRLARTIEEMGENSPEAVKAMKRIMNRCLTEPAASVAHAEAAESIRLLREADTLERVAAFLNRKE
jgi:enoyl-CoA hydratase